MTMTRGILFITLLLTTQSVFGQDIYNKAKGALAARDTTAAIAGFQEAVKAGQKAGDANYYLGALMFARHRVDEALGYLQASITINDENVDALKLAGDALMMKKDVVGALGMYRRATKLAPKNPGVNTAFGLALLGADSVDAAIVQLTRAKEFTPENAALYDALGDAYLKQNVLVLAISNYQKAAELDAKNIGYHRKLAKVLSRNRQYTEAVKEYDTVIGIDSTFAEAQLEKGRIYFLAKQYKKGIGPLLTYTQLQPKSVEGAQLYAKALFGADESADAAKAAEKALTLDSSAVEIWRIQAHSLSDVKDYAGALRAFGGLTRRNALKAEDQGKYGAALFGIGKEDEAMSALLAAVAADSTNCDPYFNLGFLYMKKQDYDNAAAMFEKKLGCDPRSLSAYVNGAACHMQRKNYSRARELLMKAIELKPDFLQGRLWLGRYYAQVDSLDLAKEQYDQVIKEGNGSQDRYKKEVGEAYQMTGSYYFIAQKYAASVESFRKAAAIGYENAGLHLSWGQALLQTLDPSGDEADNKRKKEEAIKHFRRCIELDPNNAQGHLWLGQSLVLSRVEGDNEGNKKLAEEACNEFRKALKLDPKNQDAKKSMERIGCAGTSSK
jgi:tetratricopeptide (TPR) repeat protein